MKRSRQDPRWPDAHIRLKALYDERAPEGMSQQEFGETYKIGSQGMVWQYLNGWTPLNYDAAAKFAKGLNCTIAEISPMMARSLKSEIFPVLGRAAMVALLFGMQFLSPPPAHAGEFFAEQPGCVLCQMARSLRDRLLTAILNFGLRLGYLFVIVFTTRNHGIAR